MLHKLLDFHLLHQYICNHFMQMNQHFHNWQILDSSKLREFADDNSKFDENGR